ncbi:MAG: fructose 1,6-bisphosphatase [Candidatus Aquicultor primus]|uniref:Fructose-1,6-bisphosphate aldolase/phosphatase n=1 Tax=Candidatus Aquicultor primus TaxID=1797195 RepID=A0A1F2UQA1_9ACTN|nr:MAG: fructose 1,6-bisphosphatase [Candidatus Aquicultor primus]
MADNKLTVSIIKADVGGFVGHSSVHPALLEKAGERLAKAKADGLVIDYRVGYVGDDTSLIMTHKNGVDAEPIHRFAWETFEEMTEVAREYAQYGAGQDLLVEAFSGNVRGMGPGVAEMDIEERPSEPIICFLADKTEPGAWNYPLFKMFGDPFNTAGLVIDPGMTTGFSFEIHDLINKRKLLLTLPEDYYSLLMFIGAPGRYVIKHVFRNSDNMITAVTSTQKLSLIAGRYVGKDDPVMIVRCQSGLPAVGEVLEPFSMPYMVAGWMRGSHHGPIMPTSFEDCHPSRFDGPPRVVAYGFQLAHGKLIGPRDMFEDIAFDGARRQCLEVADYIRRHGPFEPHRLGHDEMEYTTMPHLMEKFESKFEPSDD